MPATFTYPGVYIEELPSGVHAITGVATSIAAFVGWADQGPTGQATLVESWSDYQAQFGGLDARSYLGYAVNEFFANGGQQAYIVRLVWDGSQPAAPSTSPVPAATARAVGIGLATAVITATASSATGPVKGSATLTVGTPVLQSIALTPTPPPFLQSGQTLQLAAVGTYSDGSTQTLTAGAGVLWSSGATAVAGVSSSGLVTAGTTAGTAIITATLGAVTISVSVTVSAAVLTGIAVNLVSSAIAVGQSTPCHAIGSYSDGTTQDLSGIVAWTSSATATASISAAGVATAAPGSTPGTTTIGAALGAVSGSAVLTVGAASLVSLSVTPASAPWVHPAGTQQFKATGTYTDGTTQDLTATASWVSSNTAVATIAASGLATAVAVGSATMTATSGSVSGSATLGVTNATLTSIVVAPGAITLAAGQTKQLTALGVYSDSTSQDLTASVTWSSTAAAVTMSTTTNGLASAAAIGSAGVKATLGAVVSSAAAVTVTAAVLTSIAVTPASPSIAAGATQQFIATGTFTDGSTQVITGSAAWTSSNAAVATVASGGLATAVAAGGTLTLFASSPGAWGNGLQVAVTASAASPGRFSLQVLLGSILVESFANLSVVPTDPQYVVAVIDNDSAYVTFMDPATSAAIVPAAAPVATAPPPPTFAGGGDGTPLVPASDGNFESQLTGNANAGVYLLSRVEIFNLLCVPGETDGPTIQMLQAFCVLERAFLIMDAPQLATTAGLTTTGPVGTALGGGAPVPVTMAPNAGNAAFYYPWVSVPDPLFGNRPKTMPPCGIVAGIYAATDAARGVWKAPAGIDAGLTGVLGLQTTLTDLENGDLNIQGINCLRSFRVYGDVVWGARTLLGSDQAGSQWKYVPIRRLALFLETSLYDGTQWVVFEPNDERLWSQIRLNVGAFMQGLFLQGAFQGTTAQQAYFVKCDAENNPQPSIDLGIVNILVGFAPLYPAEFLVIQIQQMSGQTP
jgi:phage tail sheath protein FI